MIEKELQKRILSSIILLPSALFFIFAASFYFIFFTLICFFVSIYEWNNMVKKIEFKFWKFVLNFHFTHSMFQIISFDFVLLVVHLLIWRRLFGT